MSLVISAPSIKKHPYFHKNVNTETSIERIINLCKKHGVNHVNLSVLLSAINSHSSEVKNLVNQRMAILFRKSNALYKIPRIVITPSFFDPSEDKKHFYSSCSLIQSIRIKIKQMREQARDTIKEVRRSKYIDAIRKEIEINDILKSLTL